MVQEVTRNQAGPLLPVTAQAIVLESVRRAIVSRALLPGDRIRQEALAEELGVSTIPVREALKVLEAHGLITYQPHRGYTVAELSIEELEELYLIRRVLEAEAVRQAVPRADDDLRRRLMRARRAMRDADAAGDVLRYIDENRAFHLAIYRQAGLPQLIEYIEVLWQNSEPYRTMLHTQRPSRQRVLREVKRLEDAIRRRDPEEAVRLLDTHRANVVDDIRANLAS